MISIATNMTSTEGLINKIAKILKDEDDLGFLAKLSPKELTILASRLKRFRNPKCNPPLPSHPGTKRPELIQLRPFYSMAPTTAPTTDDR